MHSRFRTSHRKVIAGELLILRHFAPAEALDPADWLEEQGREHMQREPAGLPARGGSTPTLSRNPPLSLRNTWQAVSNLSSEQIRTNALAAHHDPLQKFSLACQKELHEI
jgi:hypothetical protein